MNADAWSIRPATPADLEGLLALEEASFAADRISRRQWRRHLASTRAQVLVCGPPDDVLAAAVVFYRRRARVARLYSLAVRADQRGHGLASALLAAVERDALRRHCRALHLEVRSDNAAAIALYEPRGYQRMAQLADYYEDGAEGWRYAKELTDVIR